MNLELWVAAKPRLLHVEDPRELEVKPRRDRRSRATATAAATTTRLVARYQRYRLEIRGLQCSDGRPILVTHIPRGSHRHRPIKTRLYRHDRKAGLVRRNCPVEHN